MRHKDTLERKEVKNDRRTWKDGQDEPSHVGDKEKTQGGTGKCPRNRGSQQDGAGEADEWPDDETLCIIKRITVVGLPWRVPTKRSL